MAVAVCAGQQADSFIHAPHKLLIDGDKESGWGREMGSQVLHNHLETKSVVTAL